MNARRLSAGLMLLVLASSAFAAASEPAAFAQGYQALQRGAVDEAIDSFELLADQGFVHPDASFDRAAAYLARARSAGARPGDLGRAVAALSETLLLRPSDEAAEKAQDLVQRELARRRARQGAADISNRPSLGRALLGLLSPDGWALLAGAGSLLLTLGLVLRRWFRHSGARLAGAISGGVGLVLLASGGILNHAARSMRSHSSPAVVVVAEAPLLTENGTPLSGVAPGLARAVPEGAEVYVIGTQGSLAQVEWGALEGWLNLAQLRILSREPTPQL